MSKLRHQSVGLRTASSRAFWSRRLDLARVAAHDDEVEVLAS